MSIHLPTLTENHYSSVIAQYLCQQHNHPVTPKKIEESANVSDVYSIFHDGCIIRCHEENGSLLSEIEIQYLAERINPTFRKLAVHLEDVKDVCFSTWPNDLKSESEALKDIASIFKAELEILEGNYREDQIQVVCNQHSPKFDYCGGELFISAPSAEIADEGGISYS
jgi:hypothetical protein